MAKKKTDEVVESDILTKVNALKDAIASGSRADNAQRVDDAMADLEATIAEDYKIAPDSEPG